MAEPATTLELRVPKPLGAVIGAIVLAAFLLFFISVAIYDLINRVAIIPSSIWLALVTAMIFGFCKELGTKHVLITILGAFAPKEFAWGIQRDDTEKEIQFGYRIFGHRLFYLTIPADKIVRVNWSAGQGSHLAGRDMNDWSAVVWFEHGDPARKQKQHFEKYPDQDLYIVGLHGKKEDTAAFGHSFLDFLRKSGASLFQGNDECTFERNPATR